MTFAKREIDLTIRLGTGTFGSTGFNTVTVSLKSGAPARG
jgi:hypothetical protein